MEFWGVEVKSGEPLLVSPGEEKLLHLSQACLGESKSKGSESVFIYVKVANQKLVLGTLSSEKFPQVSYDLVFDKEFELSHNWKNGSVYFTGYKSLIPDDPDESSDTDSEEGLPLAAIDNGKPETQPKKDVKPDVSGTKRKVKIVEPNKGGSNSTIASKKDDISDEDDEESTGDENAVGGEESDSDDQNEMLGEDSEETEDEETDDSLSEDKQTPKKAEASKKRPLESADKTPAPEKKAKLVTPQKTDGKKSVAHVATPHPSKQAAKTPAANDQTKQQTPKSAGAFPCKSCTRSFGSESALHSHSKAKHSAET